MRTNPEALYRRLVENMNEAVWVGDKNEKTTYANPKFCDMLGYSLKETLGRPSYDFWDETSADRVKRVNASHRKQGLTSSYEGDLLTKSGEKIPVLLAGTPLPDGGTIGIMTDLRELKKRESVYRRLVENMNEAVWMGDKQERTVYANPRFCQMLGYTMEEMLGKESYVFWDPESARRVKQVNMTDRKKGVASSYEGNLLTKSGEKIPVLLSGTPLPDGGTIGIMTDLRALKAQERQNRLLGSAVQHALDAIIILQPDGTILSWNKGAKVTFGFASEKVIGTSVAPLFPGEKIMELLTESETQTVELKAVHKGGTPVTLSVTLTPVRDDASVGHWLLVARDITSQRSFEDELSRRYEKLQDAYNKFGIARRQMDYVFELVQLALTTSRPQLVSDFIVNASVMLTRVDACSLRVFDPKDNSLTMLSSFGLSDDWRGKRVIKMNESLLRRAVDRRAAVKIVDIASEFSYHSRNLARKSNLTSMMMIPLLYGDRIIGGLTLYVGPGKKLEIFENDFIEKYAGLISLILDSVLRDSSEAR